MSSITVHLSLSLLYIGFTTAITVRAYNITTGLAAPTYDMLLDAASGQYTS